MFEMNQRLFDSRDLIERLEELEALEANALDDEATQEDVDEWTRDLDDELATLRKFADEANSVPDWEYGETFIREDYFVDYVEELVSDCYSLDIPDWVAIDWEATAESVKMDYSEFELDGVTYYAR